MHAHHNEDAGLLDVGMAHPLLGQGLINRRGRRVVDEKGFCGRDVLEGFVYIGIDGVAQGYVDVYGSWHGV